MTDKLIKIVFVSTFVLALLTYSFWSYIKDSFGVRIFYPFTALCFVGYTYTIYLLIKRVYTKKQKHKFIYVFSEIVYLTTINSFIDELFFNPRALELNEYIGFVLIVLIASYKYRKKWEI